MSEDTNQLALMDPEGEDQLTESQVARIHEYRASKLKAVRALYDTDAITGAQAYMDMLGAPVPESMVRTREVKQGGSSIKLHTLPISGVEALLDVFFLGQWSTHSFTHQVIANEVVGTIVLEGVHPITRQVIRRTGAAAVQIQLERGAGVSEIDKKRRNALELGFPKLKAMCVKSAAKTLGPLFGRDLNRAWSAPNMSADRASDTALNYLMTTGGEDGTQETPVLEQ